MSKMFSSKLTVAAAALASSVAIAGGAEATPTCNLANFTTSTACVAPVSGGSGGNVDEAQMNSIGGAFSGIWKLLGKADEDTSGSSPWSADTGVFTITATDTPNEFAWTLNFPFTWDLNLSVKYAFAIKGGSPSSAPDTYNAVYLMDKEFTSGFFKDKLTDVAITKDWSNVRLFGTSDLAVIPLPAPIMLLMGSIVGLAFVGRRRTAAG
jgi:hypothetical protein